MNSGKGAWLKKILSILPLSIATQVYTRIINKTPLRHPIDALIRSQIPDHIDIEEGVLLLNQHDVAVSGMLALGSYEPFETKLFRNTVKTKMTVVDIGANIGFFSVISARRVGDNGRVFSFEPEPTNYSFLKKNIEANNFSNITPIHVALSDRSGSIPLFITKDNQGAHSLVNNRKSHTSISVQTETLDAWINQHGSPVIDVIKMDIEGAEIIALEGMKQVIARSPHLTIFTEFFPNAIRRFGRNPIDMLTTLKQAGFTISIIDEDTKTLIPLIDFEKCIADFPKRDSAKNLLAVK